MSDLPFVDHHIHTVYSGHSAADMTVRALIDRAEQLGLESIAITEHAFYPLMGLSCFEQIREEVGLSDAGTKVFVGLSPDQMYRLINFPFESPGVVEFPSVLDTDPSAPIITLFRMLADAIGESGLKPTAKGNLPLKVVQEIARTYLGEEGYARFTRYGNIRSEENFYDLNVARAVAELAGLIRKYRGRFILGRECRKLLKGAGMRAVYPVLFRTFAEKFNWGYSDYYPEAGFVQNCFAYTLYLLARHGDEWRESTFYEDVFLRAFPSVTDSVKSNAYETRENTVRGMYSLRTLRRFAALMGLVEIDTSSENQYSLIFRLRTTPLIGEAVRFHI